MSEWKAVKWRDIATLEYGKSLAGYQDQVDGFTVYGTNGPIGKSDKFIFEGSSVIIGRKGAYRGVHFAEGPFFVIDTAFYLKPKTSNLDIRFAYYQLKTVDINSMDSGSAIPSTSREDFYDLDLLLPPIEEQRQIASILSSLDDKIDLLHRQNKNLEEMAETLFRQWFVEEAQVASEKTVLLGDLLDSVSKTFKFPKDGAIFLNTSDVFQGNILTDQFVNRADLPGQAKKSIARGDILFSEIRPSNGRWAYVNFDADDYVVSTKLMVLRARKNVKSEFLYFYLTSKSVIDYLQMIAETRSGTFPQITFDQLKYLVINIPSDDVFLDCQQWCETALQKILFNKNQIRILSLLRDTLLPKLMSGEITVA